MMLGCFSCFRQHGSISDPSVQLCPGIAPAAADKFATPDTPSCTTSCSNAWSSADGAQKLLKVTAEVIWPSLADHGFVADVANSQEVLSPPITTTKGPDQGMVQATDNHEAQGSKTAEPCPEAQQLLSGGPSTPRASVPRVLCQATRLALQSADGRGADAVAAANLPRAISPPKLMDRDSHPALHTSSGQERGSSPMPVRASPLVGSTGPSRLGPSHSGVPLSNGIKQDSGGTKHTDNFPARSSQSCIVRSSNSTIPSRVVLQESAQDESCKPLVTGEMAPSSPAEHRAYASFSQIQRLSQTACAPGRLSRKQASPGFALLAQAAASRLPHRSATSTHLNSEQQKQRSVSRCYTSSNLAYQEEGAIASADNTLLVQSNGLGAAKLKLTVNSQPSSIAGCAAGLGSLLSPTTVRLRAQSSGVLHVSRLLPKGLEDERAWCLSSFSLQRRLYRGYASSVYLAAHKSSGRQVALKVYDLQALPDMLMHQCYREVDVHSGLQHKHVVQLYAAFVEDARLVLVLEFAHVGDLSQLWKKIANQANEKHVSEYIMAPVLQALSYLHSQQIAHRDIKPPNIFFAADYTLKLADFGVAINLASEAAVTQTGTRPYMAPEVQRTPLKRTAEENKAIQALQYDISADIWSLGMMAYELLVGLKPDIAALRRCADAIANEEGKQQATLSANNALDSTARSSAIDSPARARPSSPADAYLVLQMNLRERMIALLPFPKGVSPAARDFVLSMLRPLPHERPTAEELLMHPWIALAAKAEGHQMLKYKEAVPTSLVAKDADVKAHYQYTRAMFAPGNCAEAPPSSQNADQSFPANSKRAGKEPGSRDAPVSQDRPMSLRSRDRPTGQKGQKGGIWQEEAASGNERAESAKKGAGPSKADIDFCRQYL